MQKFTFYSPTKIFFGKNQIGYLSTQVQKYGQKVLMTYGGGSIKKNGIYEAVMEELEDEFEVFELGGIEPNPKIESVRQGVEICRREKIDVIVAVGGGSVMDASKAIAAGYYYEADPWDLVTGKARIRKALPLLTVVTINATGSEMNGNAVISNPKTQEKLGFFSELVYPKASFLDPTYLYSLPTIQTAAGTADTMSHVFENYFKEEKAPIQDGLAEAILRTVIHYTPIAIQDPNNQEARSNLMWASTMALNNMTEVGKPGPWSCHAMEHELSAFYDITHGVGLAILTPRWMERVLDEKSLEKFVDYGMNVWEIDKDKEPWAIAEESIKKTFEFFKSIGVPMTLGQLGIGEERVKEMAKCAYAHGSFNKTYRSLTEKDIENIYRACL